MATAVVTVADKFPEGTSVSAYTRVSQALTQDGPSGTAVATATVTNGTATFTGVTEDERYVIYGYVSSTWVKQGFIVNDELDAVIYRGTEIATKAQLDALDTDTSAIEADVTAAEADIAALEADVAIINEFINVKNYGCTGDGTTDDTTGFLAALAAAEAATSTGAKVVAPPGTYLLDGEINFDQFVAFEGAGARECTLKLNDSGSYLHFNEYGGATNSRGGKVSGFHVDGNNVATTCMHIHHSVNRNFSDFRVTRAGDNGIGMLCTASQNCNITGFDIEVTRAGTSALKVTDSSGSCRFAKYSIIGGGYAGIWVTQDNSGGQEGIGYPEPRYCSFDDGIVEHGDPTTTCAVRIHSGRDLWFTRQALFVGTDQPSAGPYTIVEINDAGAGTTSFNTFDLGSVSGGTDPQKDSTAFDIQAGSDTYRTRIANYSFGNNTFGVVAASGQTVEVDNYRGPSTDTMFSGAGTIISRTFGATTYT